MKYHNGVFHLAIFHLSLTYTHQKVKAESGMQMCPIQSLPCETFYAFNISEKNTLNYLLTILSI